MNDAEFGVVFLAKGPRDASIQESLDCLGLYHSGLESERDFWLVVELPKVPPDAHPACAGPSGGFNGHVQKFGHGAPYVGERLHLFVGLPGRFDWTIVWRHEHGLCLLRRHG